MFKKVAIFIFLFLGLAWYFAASAATCPTDNGAGVGCNAAAGFYYCYPSAGSTCTDLSGYNIGSPLTNLETFCSEDIARPTCAPGVDCSNATSYNCGAPTACSSGYTLCDLAGTGNPTFLSNAKCKANVSLPVGCKTYNQCTSVCSACNDGYELVGGVCQGAAVKLGTDSVASDRLKNSSNPFLSILSSGLVGIGTTTPNSMLHLYKTNVNAELDIQSVLGVNNHWGLYNEASNNSLRLWGGDNYLTVLRDGKIGIGTTNPTENLTVIGAINSNSTINGVGLCIDGDCRTSWSGSGWSLDGNTVGQVTSIGTLDNYDIPFLSNGLERMRLTAGGDLALGAITTDVRLHVESPKGAVAFFKSVLNGGSYAGYIGNGTTFSGEEFGLYYAINDLRLATYDITNSLMLYGGHLNTDPHLVIDEGTGNVGIGTTTLTTKLTFGTATNNQIDVSGGRIIGLNNTPTEDSEAVPLKYLEDNYSPLVAPHKAINDANYTVAFNDYIIGYSAISTNRTVTLPDSVCVQGKFFIILDESGNAGVGKSIIIDPEGSTPIVGVPTYNLQGSYNSVYVFCGNNAWFIL